jgi:nucleotidyltransferase substrate binding protein (TIGR01987 family)
MDKRLALALLHFEQALNTLREVAAMPETSVVRDSLIMRFTYSFEAGWKAAYRWLRARGVDVDEGAYEVIPEAFKRRLITDEQGWGEMRRARNRTAHTYDEAVARMVAGFARAQGLALLGDLLRVLKERADE